MRIRRREALTGLAFAAVPLLGFAVFYVAPFIYSIFLSFRGGMGGKFFVGFDNYISVISSEAFRLSARNTARFMGFGVPILTVIALASALLIQNIGRTQKTFQALLMLPMVIPAASVVLFFRVLFDKGGMVNGLLSKMGAERLDILASPKVFAVILVLYVWKNMGWHIIIFLAGLAQIPKEHYEAASVDGAGAMRKLFFITLPQLGGTFFFSFVMAVMQAFRAFRESFALTGAYPADNSIYMLQHFMNNNFRNLNYQRLAPAAILVFLFVFSLTGVLMLTAGKAGEWR